MPLPAALAAKLAKRGLLKNAQRDNEPVEEVIAEDYDDMSEPKSRYEDHEEDEENVDLDSDELIHETFACPNKTNPYHSCVDYCRKRWGHKRFKADPNMIKKKEKMLAKYPIPNGWAEVGDSETGRYYYWNIQTDEVSWLPPLHPRAIVTLPADRLKELKLTTDRVTSRRRGSVGESSGEEEDDDDDASTDLDDEDIDDLDEKNYSKPKEKAEPITKGKNKRRRGRDDLDPMDPAAYSDVPRGDWSTGLDQRGTAKTGVDVTASGPLFQQRPYPSPGAVLRMNKGPKKNNTD